MKKFSAILVALVMMLALCVPAFAGANTDALADPLAKELATLLLQAPHEDPPYNYFAPSEMAAYVVSHVENIEEYSSESICEAAVTEAMAAVKEDNIAMGLNYADNLYDTVAEELVRQLYQAYTESDLGFSVFDPEDVVNNVAGGFTENDLSGLFDTMRNTITDLSDRLSNVFSGLGGGTGNGNDGTNDNSGDGNTNNGTDNSFGASEPTGDTAIYAVAGVAAVAAAALVLTKKKSASK